jgi:hypothetical protein
MKKLLAILFLLSNIGLFQACVTDSGKTATATAKIDTVTVTVIKGLNHIPRTPKVSYTTFDSLVFITIQGTGAGDEELYWIRRDGKLLEQPRHISQDSGQHDYFLADSLDSIGTHTYYVQYGLYSDSLSEKSPAYIYEYTGHSKSGSVRLLNVAASPVSGYFLPPLDKVIKKVILERRIGKDGKTAAVDTFPVVQSIFTPFTDSGLVAEDAVLYYRVRAMDALTETYLDPSPWDSIEVKNKVWKYIPALQVSVSAGKVEAVVTNPLGNDDNGKAFYFLYRNGTAAMEGKSQVDSLPLSAAMLAIKMHDHPDLGEYYYWLEARDPWGRISARSIPKSIRVTGRLAGPEITLFQVGGASIQIQANSEIWAESYILERTQDTTKAARAIDTLNTKGERTPIVDFFDRPSDDGYYYYRIIAIGSDDEHSDPGAWKRSAFFRYQITYTELSVSVVNLGKLVEAWVPDKSSEYYYVLRRYKSTVSTEATDVDTLAFSDTATVLRDKPAPGTWYYRVFRYASLSKGMENGAIPRSDLARIEFTGKPVGSAITSINVTSTRIELYVVADPEALAYVLERSPDGKEWATADTVSAGATIGTLMRDRPPTNGFWSYRIRNIGKDLTASGPGTPMRTLTAFSYAPIVVNNLSASIANLGFQVECLISESYSYSYTYTLMRGTSTDPSTGVRVDTLGYPSYYSALTDTPPLGTYYYWVERTSTYPSDLALYRSVPVRIVFNGSPDITNLTSDNGAVQVGYPRAHYDEDTLLIFRSTGNPDDLDSYSLLTSVPGDAYPRTYLDRTVGQGSGFYHYRLALRSNGVTSDLGGVKSIYYESLRGQTY